MPAESQYSYSLDGSWDSIIVKAADESVTSSTTMQDDDVLQFAVLANIISLYEFVLIYTGDGAADIKTALALVSGSFVSGIRTYEGIAAGDTSQIVQDLGNTTPIVNGANPSQKRVVRIRGFVEADANTTVKLQWAQNASSATATIVKAGSLVQYRAMVPYA